MDPDRIGFHGVARIQDGGQQLVFHFDQRQGFFCDLGSFRGDECHPVAHKPHLVIQRECVQRSGDGIRLPGSGVDDPWDILPGQHRRDALQGARLAGIDLFDPGMRMR